jgi:hypothetical protein
MSYPSGSLDLAILKKPSEKKSFWMKNDKKIESGMVGFEK